MPTRSKTAVLVDADLLIYSACTATEHTVELANGMYGLSGSLPEARGHFDAELKGILDQIKKHTPIDKVVLCVSNYDTPAFRKVWYPTYKSNRIENRRPTTFWPLREALARDYPLKEQPGLEGDDVLGVLLTDDRFLPGWRKITASIDKDMLTLPGWHVRWNRSYEPFEVTKEEADYVHMLQALTGDAVDGYKGCPGVGPVTGARILGEDCPHDDLWEAVVEAYEDAELSEKDALKAARLSRILRVEDYDFENKQPIPWEPKNERV